MTLHLHPLLTQVADDYETVKLKPKGNDYTLDVKLKIASYKQEEMPSSNKVYPLPIPYKIATSGYIKHTKIINVVLAPLIPPAYNFAFLD